MNLIKARVGLERGVEGRQLAWALDYPACFSYGKEDAEALNGLPRALQNYSTWLETKSGRPSEKNIIYHPEVVECFTTYIVDNGYEVNAFFEDDRRLLTEAEVSQALQVHAWQRQDLLNLVAPLGPDTMTRMLPGQRWNINGILSHIGRVEYWYLSNLGLPLPAPETLVHNPYRLLESTGKLIEELLPSLAGSDILTGTVEKWSPRKLVRRLLWHQRDHIGHIQELIAILL